MKLAKLGLLSGIARFRFIKVTTYIYIYLSHHWQGQAQYNPSYQVLTLPATLSKFKRCALFDPAMPFPEIYPKEITSKVHKDVIQRYASWLSLHNEKLKIIIVL